jgi:hypothetical protein
MRGDYRGREDAPVLTASPAACGTFSQADLPQALFLTGVSYSAAQHAMHSWRRSLLA